MGGQHLVGRCVVFIPQVALALDLARHGRAKGWHRSGGWHII
jgi:hypothetical protein